MTQKQLLSQISLVRASTPRHLKLHNATGKPLLPPTGVGMENWSKKWKRLTQ